MVYAYTGAKLYQNVHKMWIVAHFLKFLMKDVYNRMHFPIDIMPDRVTVCIWLVDCLDSLVFVVVMTGMYLWQSDLCYCYVEVNNFDQFASYILIQQLQSRITDLDLTNFIIIQHITYHQKEREQLNEWNHETLQWIKINYVKLYSETLLKVSTHYPNNYKVNIFWRKN